jgi:hypothetical protein
VAAVRFLKRWAFLFGLRAWLRTLRPERRTKKGNKWRAGLIKEENQGKNSRRKPSQEENQAKEETQGKNQGRKSRKKIKEKTVPL